MTLKGKLILVVLIFISDTMMKFNSAFYYCMYFFFTNCLVILVNYYLSDVKVKELESKLCQVIGRGQVVDHPPWI